MNGPNFKPEQPADAASTPAFEAGQPGAAAQPETGQPAAGAGSSAGAQAGDVARLGAEVAKLEGQIKDLTDRLLRAHADIDNLRKRAEREKEETAKFAISKFAHDVVGVSDNFQRAIAAVPAGAAEADPALKTLVEGVMLTEAELIKVMERHGVKRIDPLGETFSPHLHQAMMEQLDANVPSGTIVQVFQAGYLIDSRVIRPAMVVVAKGGPKPGKVDAGPGADGQGGAAAAGEGTGGAG